MGTVTIGIKLKKYFTSLRRGWNKGDRLDQISNQPYRTLLDGLCGKWGAAPNPFFSFRSSLICQFLPRLQDYNAASMVYNFFHYSHSNKEIISLCIYIYVMIVSILDISSWLNYYHCLTLWIIILYHYQFELCSIIMNYFPIYW